MNRTLCSLKYDVQSLTDKVGNIENMIKNDSSFGKQFVENSSESIFQNELKDLPLDTEEELDTFEKNLLNRDFRNQMVSLNLF